MDKEAYVRGYLKRNQKELTERQVQEAVWLMNEKRCTSPQNTDKEAGRVVRKVFCTGYIDGA